MVLAELWHDWFKAIWQDCDLARRTEPVNFLPKMERLRTGNTSLSIPVLRAGGTINMDKLGAVLAIDGSQVVRPFRQREASRPCSEEDGARTRQRSWSLA